MKVLFEVGKELGELRARVAALEAQVGGDGSGQRTRAQLPSCDSLREAIATLDATIEELHEELAQASPPQKPAIAAKIRKKEQARAQLQAQLDSFGGCV